MSKSDRIRTLTRLLSGYVLAAISVGIATVITLQLGPVIKHTATLFFCSVMFSSWYGGLWPGVFAALLSVVALDYYFIPPFYAFGISVEEAPDMIVFVATALFIGWLSGEQKRAKESLGHARDELELDAKVQERTAELKRANEQLQSEIAEREAAEERLARAQAKIARIVPTLHSTMQLYPVDGATRRVDPHETAFSYRDAKWSMVIVGVDPDPANAEKITAWTKDYWAALHPYSLGVPM